MKKKRKRSKNNFINDLYREQIAWRLLKLVGLISFVMIGWVVFRTERATGSSGGTRSEVVTRAGSSGLDFLQNR